VEDHEVVDQDLVHPSDRLEAVQVVLGGLGLDVAGLVGQVLARRMDPLPLGLEHPGHRVLRQPVDLQPVDEVAQLASDRSVALGVAEADRRGDVEGPLAAVGAVHGRVPRRRLLNEVADRQVHLYGLARVREVAGPLHGLQPAAGELCERPAVRIGGDLVLLPVDHQHRALDAPRECDLLRATGRSGKLRLHAEGECRAVRVERPGDGIFDLLRRVPLGHHSLRPPLHEIAVAALLPVGAVVLAPAAPRQRSLQTQKHRSRTLPQRSQPGDPGEGPDEDDPRHPLRVLRRKQHRALSAGGQADADRAVDPAGVHHVESVLRELALVVCGGFGRPVGAAIAARVEGEDAEVAGEVRDLGLPDP
jgi:hypothetical protein